MTPEERADWCLQQADELEQKVGKPGRPHEYSIGQVMVRWLRKMALRLRERSDD